MIELLLNAENALALGLLDSAEATYRTVLEADPRNGIAAIGLSRVALERGDEPGALALAQAALEIDPENATARRMVDRLEEVARFRDAPSARLIVSSTSTPADRPADSSADRTAVPSTSARADPPPDWTAEPPTSAPADPPASSTAADAPSIDDAQSPAPPARPGLLRRIFRRS